MSSPAVTMDPVLSILYDISTPAGWETAVRHRRWWGILYTVIHWLGEDTVVLTFRPAEDQQRWSQWERVRAARILEDLQGAEAA